MSNSSAKGSILLKILILVCIALLIAVIKIPNQIWSEEEFEKNRAIENMTSIYEAEKYYFRLKKTYTTDPAELIRVVRNDSSLIKLNQIVNYTHSLRNIIDSYLAVPYIKNLGIVKENIESILEDIDVNARYLRADEGIKNEAEDLKIKISDLKNESSFAYFVKTTNYLDSLKQLRRDMSDFSLQTASARSSAITDTLQKLLSMVEIEKVNTTWDPLDKRFQAFVKTITYTPNVAQSTNVHDRVGDFRSKITKAMAAINSGNMSTDMQTTAKVNKELLDIYQVFLKDFITTTRTALYSLSNEDSMILHLTEDNFYSPVHPENEMQYKIIIDSDSVGVKVESPVLFTRLSERVKPVVETSKGLPFIPYFQAYLDSVDGIMAKAAVIKKRLRKNTDIFIKNKEMEEVVKKLPTTSEMDAFQSFNGFVETAGTTQSYSTIKDHLESSLTGIRILKQMYADKMFPNIDSLHNDLLDHLTEYNEILSKVRRLPRDITNFEKEMEALSNINANMKSVPSSIVDEKLIPIENEIAVLFQYASEGDTEPVLAVFNKKVQNFGYIYQDSKSWEESKDK